MPFLVHRGRLQCAHGVLGERPDEHPEPCDGGLLQQHVLLRTCAGPVLLNQPVGDRASTFPRSFEYAEEHGLDVAGVGQAGSVCVGLFAPPPVDMTHALGRMREASALGR